MKSTEKITPEEKKRLEEVVRNAPPCSKIEAAKKLGVDLDEVIRRLEMTPTQRVQEMERKVRELEAIESSEKEEL